MELAPTPDAHDGLPPGRLWNLWDVMLKYGTGEFIRHIKSITGISQCLEISASSGEFAVLTPEAWGHLRSDIAAIARIASETELPATKMAADSLLQEMVRAAVLPDGRVSPANGNLVQVRSGITRVLDFAVGEAMAHKVLFLTAKEAALYGASPGWAQKFNDQFPTCAGDLEDAHICAALGRGTATVFHVARILEIGLRAIRACLDIQIPLDHNEKNWGTILRRVKDAIEGRGKNWSEAAHFSELYAFLNAVKGCWRNPTMHVEEKYTPEEAERILHAARSFMESLSDRMDENGEPKA